MQLNNLLRSILLFLLILCVKHVRSQFTYAIYGGTAYHSEDTSNIQYKDHYLYLLSDEDQKVRITNYNDIDTSIQLLANQTRSFKVKRKLISLPLYENGKVRNRGIFLVSSKPVKIVCQPLLNRVFTTPDPYDVGLSGSYSVLEKNNCGSKYNLYFARTIFGYYNVSTRSVSIWTNSVIAYDDSTWVDFDLQFETELGKKFSVLLNKGQVIQLSQQQYPNNVSKFWPNNIGHSKITTRDCKKNIAVYNSNIGSGVNLDPTKSSLDFAIYPANGMEMEQLQPSNKWGYEYLLVSDGESYMGNTYHINNIGPNEILFNGQLKKFSKDTLIYDTIFGRTLLLQSRKPIMVMQHVSGAINYSAFGAPNDKILANVIDITTAPPTNNLLKKSSVPIPSRVGTNLINRLVLFSPGNRRITINGKNRILTKQNKGIYYGSFHNPDTIVNIESTTGFNGYIIHTGANDTTFFSRNGSPQHRSGVFSFPGDWDTIKPRIRINKQGVYWLGVDDTGIVSICRNTPMLAELEVGWNSFKNVKFYLDDTLIVQKDSTTLTFQDTGYHTLKFEFEFTNASCDSQKINWVKRQIYVFPEPQKLFFNDTLLCSNDTLTIIATKDPQSKVTWKSTIGSICDTCKVLRYTPVIGQVNQLNLKITRAGCPVLLDTVTVASFDSLKLESLPINPVCSGAEIQPQFLTLGGDSSRWRLTHYFENEKIVFPYKVIKAGRLMSILTDGCSYPNDTLIHWVDVYDSLKISGIHDTQICANNQVNITSWFLAKGGKNPELEFQDILSGLQHPDTFEILKNTKIRIVGSDGCAQTDTLILTINVPDSMILKDKWKLKPLYCQFDSVDFSWKINGGMPPFSGVVQFPNGNKYDYTDTFLSSQKKLDFGIYSIAIKDQCNQIFLDTIQLQQAKKPSIKIDSLVQLCANEQLNLPYQIENLNSSTTIETELPANVIEDTNRFYGNPKHGVSIRLSWSDVCFGDSILSVKIHRLPNIKEVAWDTFYCSGHAIQLYPLKWEDSTINPPIRLKLTRKINEIESHKMVQSQGNWLDVETIRLYDTGSNKLELTVNKITGEPCYQWNSEVWVSQSPIAQFKVLKDPIVQGKEFDVFNYSENAHRYQWFVDGFNQGQSTHLKETFNDTLIHSIALWAWNEMGCEDSLLKFYRAHFPTTIYWPNAFTPNDDELNNTWYPTGVNVLAYHITIYNRWGEKVFDGQRNQPFDGTYQGRPLLEGVYVAVVEIEDVEHQHKKESRTLVLLRNK